MKRGETPEQALKRELQEELGIEAIDPELITVVEDFLPEPEGRLRQHFFLVKRWRGLIANKSEHSEIRWFSKDELKELPVGQVGRTVIEKHLKNMF